ncbi:hypothetical protein ABZZ92_20445 [Streptomyces ardesiacus]|uniref:hypothetical protein n=1 Tax=Streptomyces ardesiacus TaxID=285564 RepID=UPI0033A3AA6E
MSARTTPMLALAAVALGLALTACGNGGGGGPYDALASGSPTATATGTAQPPAAGDSAPAGGSATGGTSSRTPEESKPDRGQKCTDRVNYAGDPRPNAEINSIGEETGTCPPVRAE